VTCGFEFALACSRAAETASWVLSVHLLGLSAFDLTFPGVLAGYSISKLDIEYINF
jgi:hypothetical protein